MEINKGASAAPVVRGQPLFTGTRRELFTNIRYERRLCHEYRAGLEAGCLIMGESRYEGPWKSSLVLASPQNITLLLTASSKKVTLQEDTTQYWLSSWYAHCMSDYDVEHKASCLPVWFSHVLFITQDHMKALLCWNDWLLTEAISCNHLKHVTADCWASE